MTFLYFLIKSANFFISISISFIPKAVSFCSFNSNIEFTCFSVKEYKFLLFLFSTNFISFNDLFIFHLYLSNNFFASSGFLEDLIILIILSIFSTLTDKPINIWALSSDLIKSYLVFLITTSCLNFRKLSKNSFKLHVFGLLSTIAKVLKPNELSIDVYLNNWRFTVSGSIFLLKSIATLIPSLLDSSLISLTPSIFLSLTNSAIFSFNEDLLTW